MRSSVLDQNVLLYVCFKGVSMQHMTNKHTRKGGACVGILEFDFGKQNPSKSRKENMNAPAFLSISVNMELKCFPLSEFRSSSHVRSL